MKRKFHKLATCRDGAGAPSAQIAPFERKGSALCSPISNES